MTITNIDQAGFRWKKSLVDGSAQPVTLRRSVASNYGTALYPGQPVTQLGDGSVGQCAGSEGAAPAPLGVINAIGPYYNGSEMVYGTFLPANTVWGTNQNRISIVHVIPALNQLFEIDTNNAGANDTLGEYRAMIGSNADHVISGTEVKLDLTSVGTDAEQWRIMDIGDTVNNRAWDQDDVKMLVTLNEGATQFSQYGTTGI